MEELFIFNSSRLLTSPSSPSSPSSSWSVGPVGPVELTPGPVELSKAVILGVFCLLGVPGNVLVLALLLCRGPRRRRRSDFTHQLMLNLAACDLLYVATLPAWALHAARPQQRHLQRAACKLLSCLVFCSLYVNIFTITLMSVQRYVTVLHRHRWARLGPRGERALLLGLWTGSCLLTWPSVESTGRTGPDGHFDCSRPARMEGRSLTATLLELLLGFVVPFSIMSAFYCCLDRKVKEKASLSSSSSRTSRTSQLISRIMVTFLVLWVPIQAVGAVGLVGGALRARCPTAAAALDRFTEKARVVKNLPLLSAIIDPFLYAYSFRRLWTRSRALRP